MLVRMRQARSCTRLVPKRPKLRNASQSAPRTNSASHKCHAGQARVRVTKRRALATIVAIFRVKAAPNAELERSVARRPSSDVETSTVLAQSASQGRNARQALFEPVSFGDHVRCGGAHARGRSMGLTARSGWHNSARSFFGGTLQITAPLARHRTCKRGRYAFTSRPLDGLVGLGPFPCRRM